jgi:hypothetical protein
MLAVRLERYFKLYLNGREMKQPPDAPKFFFLIKVLTSCVCSLEGLFDRHASRGNSLFGIPLDSVSS